MSELHSDIASVIKYYVKKKSKSEEDYEKQLRKQKLKICEQITHQHSYGGTASDSIRIVAQLSQSHDNCAGAETFNGLFAPDNQEDSSSASPSSRSNSDHFIKSVKVSHGVKSKSLDSESKNRISNNHHQTNIVAVIGSSSCPYDTVCQTTIDHTDDGKKVVYQNSFTRPAYHSSFHSLPSQTNNIQISPFNEKSDTRGSKLKSKFKRLISKKRKHDKEQFEFDVIEDLAKEYVKKSVNEKENNMSTPIISPMSLKRDLPFKSHQIGTKLTPVRKGKNKKFSHYFQSLFSPYPYLSPCSSKDSESIHSDFVEKSTNFERTAGEPVNKVVMELSRNKDTKEFKYATNLDSVDYTDNSNYVDDNNNDRNNSTERDRSISVSHFDVPLTPTERLRRQSCPDKIECLCENKRLDLIADILIMISEKRCKNEIDMKKDELGRFSCDKRHFDDCTFRKSSLITGLSSEDLRKSRISLYSVGTCDLCESNVDEQLSSGLSKVLLPLIYQMEHLDEIELSKSCLEYFLNASCYGHFESGFLSVVGDTCTLENVALLHYIVKCIVQHIGDPSDDENRKIKKVIKNTEKFFCKYYLPHIKNKHGTIDDFLIHCSREEVD